MDHPKLAAIAVVLHDDAVLLVRRKNEPDANLWGFPGGHVDFGETAKVAAARELFEETEVIAEPLEYLTNLDIIVRDQAGAVTFHYLLVAVLCRYKSGAPCAHDDVHEAVWVDCSTVFQKTLPMSGDVDTILQAALDRRCQREGG